MPRRRTTLAVLAALAAALVATLSLPAIGNAQSKTNVVVGMGDQHLGIFSDPNYQALGVKRVRYFIRWDAIRNPAALSAADQYVFAAKAAGAKVLMHISTNDLRPGKAKLPTVAQYKRDVGALVKRYKPLGVTEWGTWNEANHETQPTFRSARRKARAPRLGAGRRVWQDSGLPRFAGAPAHPTRIDGRMTAAPCRPTARL